MNDVTSPADALNRALHRLDRLSLFAGMWAITELFHLISFGVWIYEPVGIALFVATIAVLVQPSSAVRLLLACSLDAAYVFVRSPHTANHILFNGMVSLTVAIVLGTMLWRSRRAGLERDRVVENLAHPIRVELLLLYFFAVVHKLNHDFLNPEVSAAGELLRQLQERFGFVPTTDGAIVATALGTLAVEIAIPLLLVVRRWSHWGVLLGMGFHFGLALHPHQGIFSFSAMLFLLYTTFFVPKDFVDRLRCWLAAPRMRRLLLPLFALRQRAFAVVGVLAALGVLGAVGILLAGVDLKHLREQALLIGTILWVPWAMLVAFVVIRTLQVPSTDAVTEPVPWRFRAMMLVPALMLAYYLGPYFGFGTTRCLSMFSNLRTEGPSPNHMLFPKSWQFAPYQDDLVEVLAANDTPLAEIAENGELLPWWEFRRYVHEANGPLQVAYVHAGTRHEFDTRTGGAHGVPELPWLPAKFMSFRPVDKSGPAKSRW